MVVGWGSDHWDGCRGGVSCGQVKRLGVGEFDGGGAVVADTGVRLAFHPVGVVAGPFDDSRVGPVSAYGVEVSFGDDVRHDLGQEFSALLRGEMPPSR
jgi:hypothetical protein